MAVSDSDIALVVGVDIKGMVKGLNDASNYLGKFRTTLNENGADFIKYSAVLSGVGAAITAHLVDKAIEAIGAQDDLANQLNTTVESVATLKRAADLSGISQAELASSTKKLSVFLAQASDAGSAQSQVMDRLGLSAEKVAKLPVDERFALINKAIHENIPITEQAAIAAEAFGKAGLKIATIDFSTIEEARRQTQLLGLALSDVQSSQVEYAGDAMSIFSAAADGAAQKVAVKLSPAISQLSDDFLKLIEDSDGIGNAIDKRFNKAAIAIGFVADSAEGFYRVFSVIANAIEGISLALVKSVVGSFRGFTDAMEETFGDKSGIAKKVAALDDELEAQIKGSMRRVKEAATEPLPSERFEEWYKKAQEASQKTAEEAVKTKKIIDETGGSNAKDGMSPAEKAEAERKAKELAQAKEKAEKISKQQDEARQREMESQQADIDSRYNALVDANKTELQLLNDKLEEDQITIDDAYATKRISLEQYQEQEAMLVERHNMKVANIEKEYWAKRKQQEEAAKQAKITAVGSSLGAIGAILEQGNKKQFELGKKFALAAAAVNMYQGISVGVSKGYAGIPEVLWATANGLAAINNIRNSTFGGGGSGAGQGNTMITPSNSYGNQSAPQQQQSATTNVYIRGLNPGDIYSGQSFIDAINTAVKDGGVIKI